MVLQMTPQIEIPGGGGESGAHSRSPTDPSHINDWFEVCEVLLTSDAPTSS